MEAGRKKKVRSDIVGAGYSMDRRGEDYILPDRTT
jgi:hypothetical protein